MSYNKRSGYYRENKERNLTLFLFMTLVILKAILHFFPFSFSFFRGRKGKEILFMRINKFSNFVQISSIWAFVTCNLIALIH